MTVSQVDFCQSNTSCKGLEIGFGGNPAWLDCSITSITACLVCMFSHLCDCAGLPSCHFDLYFLPYIIVASCCLRAVLWRYSPGLSWITRGGVKCKLGQALRAKRRRNPPEEFPPTGGGPRLYSHLHLLQGPSFLQENSLGHMKTFASKINSCRQNFSRKYPCNQFKLTN